MKRLAACLLALVCSPAMAGGYDFAVDGMIKEIDLDLWVGEVHTPAERSAMYFYPVGLGWTLEEVQRAFGGVITIGADNEAVDGYVCYRYGDSRILYLADDGEVDWIVAERSKVDSDPHYGCTDQPNARLRLNEDFPQLGATTAELEAHFGVDLAAGNDRELFYQLEENESYDATRTIYYRLKDGIVDGISLAYEEDR